jgi:hypothetical protein
LSTLAKVLVFLTLLLSLFVPTAVLFLFAQSKNYKAMYEEKNSALTKKQEEYRGLEAKYKALETAKATAVQELEGQINQLTKEKADLQNDKRDLTNQKKALELQVASLTQANNTAQKTIEDLTAQNENLLDLKKKAEETATQALNEREKKNIELAIAMSDMDALITRNRELAQQVDDLRNALVRLRSGGVVGVGEEVLPPMEGHVEQVDAHSRLVVVSLGSSDGLKTGWKLTVFRMVGDKPQFVGEVQVMTVQEQRSSARRVLLAKDMSFRVGDKVTTR